MVFFGVEVASVFVCVIEPPDLFHLGELPTLKGDYRSVGLFALFVLTRPGYC